MKGVHQSDKKSELENEMKILWDDKINNRTTLFYHKRKEKSTKDSVRFCQDREEGHLPKEFNIMGEKMDECVFLVFTREENALWAKAESFA